jgi:hypothetical protein
MDRIACTNSAMPTAAMANDTTMARICIKAPGVGMLRGRA